MNYCLVVTLFVAVGAWEARAILTIVHRASCRPVLPSLPFRPRMAVRERAVKSHALQALKDSVNVKGIVCNLMDRLSTYQSSDGTSGLSEITDGEVRAGDGWWVRCRGLLIAGRRQLGSDRSDDDDTWVR